MSNVTNCAAAAAVRLTVRHPFWTEIFYSMGVKEDSPQVPTLATDGRSLWINTKFWASLNLDLQLTALVHEMAHKILLHGSRMGTRDPEIWNAACDHAVNTMLKNNKFTIGESWLCDMKYDGWLAEAIYADLMKEKKANPNKQFIHPDQMDVLPTQGTPEQIEAHEAEVKKLVGRAIANARAMGQLPAGIEAGTVDVYKAAREPWFNHLHRYMQSLAISEYNWARLNRRTLKTHGVFSPLHLSEALGDVALFIDASGSCYDAASQANFAGHLNGILAEARPRRVHVYYFDAAVYKGEVIEAGELDVVTHPRGGGGTAFEPIFKALEDDGVIPDVCIILTDLYGSFPHSAPEYPVVWANIMQDGEAPFGETIYVE